MGNRAVEWGFSCVSDVAWSDNNPSSTTVHLAEFQLKMGHSDDPPQWLGLWCRERTWEERTWKVRGNPSGTFLFKSKFLRNVIQISVELSEDSRWGILFG